MKKKPRLSVEIKPQLKVPIPEYSTSVVKYQTLRIKDNYSIWNTLKLSGCLDL